MVSVFALLVLVAGCGEAKPPPRQSSEAYLARRAMAREVIAVAEEARAATDPRLEAAAYQLLIDLWPDFPEARTGGAWHNSLARAEHLIGVHSSLMETRIRAGVLQDRLQVTGMQIDAMSNKLNPVSGLTEAPRPAHGVPTLACRAAVASAAGGVGQTSGTAP